MNGNVKDLTDLRFGRLEVLSFAGISKYQKSLWLCKCDCGIEKVIVGGSLMNGSTKSCGCLIIENITMLKYSHGMRYTYFYKIWGDVKQRCNGFNRRDYKWYGGRGITYDPRWEIFENFYDDMYLKYLYAKKQLKIKRPSIERIDVNGNYCKENCTFIDMKDQHKNTRRNKWFIAISPNGKMYKSKTKAEFARKHELTSSQISNCLNGKREHHKGWKFKLINKEFVKAS